MNWKNWRHYIIHISLLLMIIFLLLIYLSIYAIFISSSAPIVSSYNNISGDWKSWILGVSFLGFFISLYYFIDYFKKLKKFKELINSDSKSKFISNIKELEIISYRLGPKYKDQLENKKKYWKIQ